MVIIPARDEELFIFRAVDSFPRDTVIVVDDHSTDQTAKAARKAGAGVLPAPDVPRGAVGKANACLAGTRLLNSKWMLLVDADTHFAPGFLESAVGCAEASGVAFLSIHLRPEMVRWSEQALFPYAQALFFSGVVPRGDPTAVFNGQCVLVRREAYEFLGGHAAVLNSLIDDVKIAALATRQRLMFGSVRAEALGYARVREPLACFRRSAHRFLLISFWSGATVLIAAMLGALWLPALAWLLIDGHWIAAAIYALLPSAAMLVWYRNFWRALLAPVALCAMPAIFLRYAAAALMGHSVEWKGRVI
jgi:chlorobactene glucosyltransferase